MRTIRTVTPDELPDLLLTFELNWNSPMTFPARCALIEKCGRIEVEDFNSLDKPTRYAVSSMHQRSKNFFHGTKALYRQNLLYNSEHAFTPYSVVNDNYDVAEGNIPSYLVPPAPRRVES